MTFSVTGLIIGILFGASLFLSGLTDPDRIIGSLRLKDYHALRVILLFIIVPMAGVWALDAFGLANFNITTTAPFAVILGGLLLGAGVGMTGYGPALAPAAAATGRADALIATAGMLLGALAFIFLYPATIEPLTRIANAGKLTLVQATGIPRFVWAICLFGLGLVAIILTIPETKKNP